MDWTTGYHEAVWVYDGDGNGGFAWYLSESSAIPVVSQAEAEDGTLPDIRAWTPLRIAQAIEALGGGGAGTPGGADTNIQFNDSGTFSGSARLVVNKTTGEVNITSSTSDSTTHILRLKNSSSTEYMTLRSDGYIAFNSQLQLANGGIASNSSGASLSFTTGGGGTGNMVLATANSGTDKNIIFSPDGVGKAIVMTNTGTLPVSLGGSLKVDTSTVGNVGSGEDNLVTYSVPAAQLKTNGDYIEFDCWGTCAANANTKQIRVYFGSTVLVDGGAVVLNGVSWRDHGKIVRTGAATQIATCTLAVGGSLLASSNTSTSLTSTPAETLSGAVTFKVTGASAISPNDNDIVQKGMIVRFYPNQ